MFSERLRLLRKEKSVTQNELAKILNIERSSIGKYESANVIPSVDVLKKISDYFSVSIDYLLGKSESRFTVPDIFKNETLAFYREEFEELTQDEIDKLAIFAKMMKEDRINKQHIEKSSSLDKVAEPGIKYKKGSSNQNK